MSCFRYRIDLCYEGSKFHGWQSQSSGMGAQDFLEKALRTALRTHDLRIIAASRTDSGVHAEGQVATFDSDSQLDCYRLRRSLEALVPDSMGINAVTAVDQGFHPVYAALGKAYRYRLWVSPRHNPFVAQAVWHVHWKFDVDVLRAAMQIFVGEHDFKSFAASDSSAKTSIRKIYEIDCHQHGELVDIWVLGSGFLKQMVRNLVGTAVHAGLGRFSIEEVRGMLAALDRCAAGPTAPAHALTLVKVFYRSLESAAALQEQARAGYSVALPGLGPVE